MRTILTEIFSYNNVFVDDFDVNQWQWPDAFWLHEEFDFPKLLEIMRILLISNIRRKKLQNQILQEQSTT